MSAICNFFAHIAQLLRYPSLTALSEDGLQVAFEQDAGVLQVLFGIGLGGGDAVKRFVENATMRCCSDSDVGS